MTRVGHKMAFQITELSRTPADRAWVHAYDTGEEGTLEAGDRIRVQIQVGDETVTLLNETVPNGKVWTDIHFQFQAQEDSV